MRMRLAVTAGLIAVVAIAGLGSAQTSSGAGGGQGGVPGSGIGPQNHLGANMTQDQFNNFMNYADQAKRLTKEDKAAGKTLAQVLAEDKLAAAALAKAMPLNCDVTDAMKIAEGPETVDGQTVQTQTYEAVCANGMGYFLVKQDPAKPYGLSCFAFDATAKADIAAGRKPGAVCRLPANADLKLVAAKMLAASGIACTVKDYRWVGQSAANHIEFDEVACDNGQGYMMIVALPGAQIPVHVETCNQSAKRGIACKLSDNGDVGPTLKSFRDVLARYKVACQATDQTTRVIGQIESKKLLVVEFACLEMPKGLVAYIPQEGSKSPFEVVDCPTAAKRGAVCALPGNNR